MGGGCQGRSNSKHTGRGPSYRRISKQSLAGWAGGRGSRGNGGGGKSAQWDCLPALVLQLPLVCLAARMSGASLARPCQCETQKTKHNSTRSTHSTHSTAWRELRRRQPAGWRNAASMQPSESAAASTGTGEAAGARNERPSRTLPRSVSRWRAGYFRTCQERERLMSEFRLARVGADSETAPLSGCDGGLAGAPGGLVGKKR